MPIQQMFLGLGAYSGETQTYSTQGTYTSTVDPQASSLTVKVWGAGGAGDGECPSGNFSGGNGGHVEGTIAVTGGSTVSVYVGGSTSGSQPGLEGYGAGAGGGLSAVKYSGNILVAGGGGGAGQNGQGGGGGGNSDGTSGTGASSNYYGRRGTTSGAGGGAPQGGSSGSSWNNGSNLRNGGASGGSGVNQGNRGGGGGAGYYGGGGGGGDPSGNGNCTGGGGGGGSGIISGSWTNTVSTRGSSGTAGGRTASDTGDPDYVSGRGGSGQDGLVVLIYS